MLYESYYWKGYIRVFRIKVTKKHQNVVNELYNRYIWYTFCDHLVLINQPKNDNPILVHGFSDAFERDL